MSKSTRPPHRAPRGTGAGIAARRAQVAALHPTLTLVEIGGRLNMKPKMVADDCRVLGLRKSKGQRAAALIAGLARSGRPVWNDALREVLALMYPHMKNPALAEFLGFTEMAVAGQARAMKLRKAKVEVKPGPTVRSPRQQTMDARLADVLANYKTMTRQQLADKHGVGVDTIQSDLAKLKLLKPKRPDPTVPTRRAAAALKPTPDQAVRLMSPLQLEKHIAAREKLRITYTPETLPWKARVMFAPATGFPDLTYRGQRA